MRPPLNFLIGVAALAATTGPLACGARGSANVTAPEYSIEQAADSIPLPFRAEVKVGDVWMSLADVPADSRCGRGVVCVWAGDAVAELVVHPGCYKAGCRAASALLTLHTTLEPRAGEAMGLKVQLLSLLPYPVHGQPTPREAYVAWVRVTPAS